MAYDLNKLGKALLANKEVKDALKNHELSVAMLEKMHLDDEENVMVAHTLALSLEGYAKALETAGNLSKALAMYQRSLEIEVNLNANSENPEFQIKIAQLYFNLGQIREAMSNLKRAIETPCQNSQKDFQKSVETFTAVQKSTVLSPTNLEIYSQARHRAECGKV